ncbi:hypothetical protein ACJBU6_07717 [Exserohilum turcicum]
MNAILEILHECPSPTRRETLEDYTLQIRGGLANAGRTLDLGALMEAWRREGYHEHLLRRYAWYRMIRQAPSRQHAVNLIVSELFDKPWERRRWDQTADRTDESDLRIHYVTR